jgi:polar amino acid transport system substrate-binding protein
MNKSNKSFYAWLIIIAVLVLSCSIIYTNYIFSKSIESTKDINATSLYERVIDNKVIKVGYYNGEPYFIKNPNTGEISGIFAEILNKVGEDLSIKIEWVGEANFATMSEDLEVGKFDIIGSGIWINAQRGKVSDFSIPLFFDVVGAYSRANDNRFDNDLGKINSPEIKISTIDGEMAAIIAAQDYPMADANTASLPESADFTQMLVNVENGKADVTFLAIGPANKYMAENPNSLKLISKDHPIRLFPTAIMIKRNEYEFTRMLNLALIDLINSGFVDQVIKKHEALPLSHYRLAKPFRASIE